MGKTKAQVLADAPPGYTSARKIANNTVKIIYPDGIEVVRLHNTDILTTDTKTGFTRFDSGGYRTRTTKDRMETYNPAKLRISQVKGLWTIAGQDYYDGITFDSTGQLLSKAQTADRKAIERTQRKIKAFLQLVDTADPLPEPSPGDCWLCCLRDNNGIPWGDQRRDSPDTGHLWNHLDEGYLHGSLIVNAMLEKGYTMQQVGTHYILNIRGTIKRALHRFLQRRLIPNLAR